MTEDQESMRQLSSSLRAELSSLTSLRDVLIGLESYGSYTNPVQLALKVSGPSTDSGPPSHGSARTHGVE